MKNTMMKNTLFPRSAWEHMGRDALRLLCSKT
jgi:hypothetical protein